MKQTEHHATVSLSTALRTFIGHMDNWPFLIAPIAMISYLFIVDAGLQYLFWLLLGWLVFLPQEYLTHVFVLHLPAARLRRLYRLQYRLHHGHHDFPKRLDLMYMPLWLTLPMTLMNAGIMALFTTTTEQWLAAMSGALCGYVVFEWFHMLSHVPYRPKSQWLRKIRQKHLWHHHKDHHRWFSVSWPAMPMDWIAGTGGNGRSLPASQQSRLLGLEEQDQRIRDARRYFESQSSGDLSCSNIWLIVTSGIKQNQEA